MSKIVCVAEGDHQSQDVIPVAKMINELMKQSNCPESEISDFENQFLEAVEKDSYDAIFFLFADKLKLVVNQPEKKDKYKLVESYFTTLIYVMTRLSSLSQMEASVDKIIQLLTDDGEYASMRLRLLMLSYNIIPVTNKTSSLSKALFHNCVTYAQKQGLFAEIVPYLNFVDEWIKKWELPDSSYQKELYYIVAHELPRMEDLEDSQAFTWLKKYLSIETEVTDKSVAAIKLFFQQIVKIPSVYQVEDFLDLKLLQVAKGKPGPASVICEALQLFVNGDLEAFKAFKQRNPKFIADMEISEDAIVRKLRVLTLCSLAQNRSSVPLAEIRQKLNTEDVDDIIIEGCHYNVLCGRIDEVNQVFVVQSVLQREFRTEEWKQPQTMLTGWQEKIKKLRDIQRMHKEAQQVKKMGGA